MCDREPSLSTPTNPFVLLQTRCIKQKCEKSTVCQEPGRYPTCTTQRRDTIAVVLRRPADTKFRQIVHPWQVTPFFSSDAHQKRTEPAARKPPGTVRARAGRAAVGPLEGMGPGWTGGPTIISTGGLPPAPVFLLSPALRLLELLELLELVGTGGGQ